MTFIDFLWGLFLPTMFYRFMIIICCLLGIEQFFLFLNNSSKINTWSFIWELFLLMLVKYRNMMIVRKVLRAHLISVPVTSSFKLHNNMQQHLQCQKSVTFAWIVRGPLSNTCIRVNVSKHFKDSLHEVVSECHQHFYIVFHFFLFLLGHGYLELNLKLYIKHLWWGFLLRGVLNRSMSFVHCSVWYKKHGRWVLYINFGKETMAQDRPHLLLF